MVQFESKARLMLERGRFVRIGRCGTDCDSETAHQTCE